MGLHRKLQGKGGDRVNELFGLEPGDRTPRGNGGNRGGDRGNRGDRGRGRGGRGRGGRGGGGRGNNLEDVDTDPTILLARSDIIALMREDRALAAKFVRLGFHDCIGICDGCVDLTNVDNFGLETPIEALGLVVQRFSASSTAEPAHGILSRADIWALAALTAADVSSGNEVRFPMMFTGRIDCGSIATGGPHRELPKPDFTTHEVFDYFLQNFGFVMQQTVALLGGHSIGSLSRENSGFDGQQGWVRNNNRLSNDYYQQIVGGRDATDDIEELADAPQWTQNFVDNSDVIRAPDRFQWERNGNRGRGRGRGGGRGTVIMLNSDIAITRNLTGHLGPTGEADCTFRGSPPNRCPIATESLLLAAEYKFDNTKFLVDFADVYNKVLVQGYGTPTCVTPPCPLTVSR
eukprot:scaffold28405_cov49-Attheya_sp.AAC.1